MQGKCPESIRGHISLGVLAGGKLRNARKVSEAIATPTGQVFPMGKVR